MWAKQSLRRQGTVPLDALRRERSNPSHDRTRYPWMPCAESTWCGMWKWFSASVINQRLPYLASETLPGLIVAPGPGLDITCAWAADGHTMDWRRACLHGGSDQSEVQPASLPRRQTGTQWTGGVLACTVVCTVLACTVGVLAAIFDPPAFWSGGRCPAPLELRPEGTHYISLITESKCRRFEPRCSRPSRNR